MPLAAAGIVKLGNGVMPLAVVATIPNNIMLLAAVTKCADKLRPSVPPSLPPLLPWTVGTVDDLPSPIVHGPRFVARK